MEITYDIDQIKNVVVLVGTLQPIPSEMKNRLVPICSYKYANENKKNLAYWHE